MPRSKFDRELKRIKEDLKAMSKLVQENLSDAMTALRNRDMEIYSKVIKLDMEEIDVLYREIEELCIQTIALHQPVAGDLRFISTAMIVVANLERIGDYSKDIAQVIPFIEDEPPVDDIEEILQEMGKLGVVMTRHAMNSFVNKNKKYVDKVNIDEEKIDALYGGIFPKLKERAGTTRDSCSITLNLLLAARYLERIGDHAVNISKRSMFVINGAWKYI